MTNATNETATFTIYKALVIDAVGCTVDAANFYLARIGKAYDMGEPVWMIAEEIALRVARPRATKTPRALAQRVVRA